MADPETMARTLGYPKCPRCGTVHQVELTPGVVLPAICGECGAALEIVATQTTEFTTRLRGPVPAREQGAAPAVAAE